MQSEQKLAAEGNDMADDKLDLAAGIPAQSISEQPLSGVVDGEPVLIVRAGGRLCAVSGKCTHLGAPLETGLVVGNEIRCPWHHARFALSTGVAVGAPAFKPLSCYAVEECGDVVRVTGRSQSKHPRRESDHPGRVIIVGGGGAGYACADMLARAGWGEHVTLLSADRDPPYDRTFCSKHYLTGEKSRADCLMPTAGLGLGSPPTVRTGTEVSAIDVGARGVLTADGDRIGYDTLVLATGARPVSLNFAGSDHHAVHTLRSLADADGLIAASRNAKTAVILGASFIGLEVAASLIARKLEVTVVAEEAIPLAAVLGDQVGRYVRSLHASKGVRFRLGRNLASYDGTMATLNDGSMLQADILVVGVGVTPRLELAEAAGLKLADNKDGVAVDGYFATSVPHVYAIGDIASYPDSRLGHPVRIEHWVHAQRQGQHLARLLTGETTAPFGDVPFFWSTHHDIGIHYIGHAAKPEFSRIEGSIDDGDFALFLAENGAERALVTLERDIVSLQTEAGWENKGE